MKQERRYAAEVDINGGGLFLGNAAFGSFVAGDVKEREGEDLDEHDHQFAEALDDPSDI